MASPPHVYFLEDQKGSTKLHVGLSYQIVTKQVYKLIYAPKQSMSFTSLILLKLTMLKSIRMRSSIPNSTQTAHKIWRLWEKFTYTPL